MARGHTFEHHPSSRDLCWPNLARFRKWRRRIGSVQQLGQKCETAILRQLLSIHDSEGRMRIAIVHKSCPFHVGYESRRTPAEGTTRLRLTSSKLSGAPRCS